MIEKWGAGMANMKGSPLSMAEILVREAVGHWNITEDELPRERQVRYAEQLVDLALLYLRPSDRKVIELLYLSGPSKMQQWAVAEIIGTSQGHISDIQRKVLKYLKRVIGVLSPDT